MDKTVLAKIEEAERESAELDFKAAFDTTAPQDWCELIKDVVAMANSGGGLIVFGVNDDGTPAIGDLKKVQTLDPATVVDKVEKYTDQHFANFSFCNGSRCGAPVVGLVVCSASIPIVFTAPGTYEVGGGKQKTRFRKAQSTSVMEPRVNLVRPTISVPPSRVS